MTKERIMRIAAARRHAQAGTGKAIREAAKVPPSEVAAAVGINESTLWRWEGGVNMPRGSAAARWAAILIELEKASKVEPAA